jgi:hypothetical protein
MKFIGHQLMKTVYLETETGVDYRTDLLGNHWQCRYGESWESVWGSEELQCKSAYLEYLSTNKVE